MPLICPVFLVCPAWLTTASRWHCGLAWPELSLGALCKHSLCVGEKLRGDRLRCSLLHQLELREGMSGGGGESGELWPASWGDGPRHSPLEAEILCCGLGVLGLFQIGARTGLTNSSRAQNKLYSPTEH